MYIFFIRQIVLNLLFKHTQLQTSFGINIVALVNGQPKTLNLRDIFYHYVNHRKDVIQKRTEYDLRIAKNRLKAVDTNRLQSGGNITNKRYVDRFSGVHRGMPGYGTYNQNVNFHTSKIELFTDYEAMDMDAILSSALDIYADESTVKDADGDTLTIKSSNDEIRK